MKKVKIEFFRYEKEGSTCERCCDSTEIVKKIVNDFKTYHKDIDVELNIIPLKEDMIGLSNTVRINGKDIRDILGMPQKILTLCSSCSDMVGAKTNCTSYVYKGKIYDSLPEEMLKEAIYKEARRETD